MRFQTMAILQYARFKKLGYSVKESQSLGLAFALFYAIMKNRRWYGSKKKEKTSLPDKTIGGECISEPEENIFGLRLKYVISDDGTKLFKMANKICDEKEWFNRIVTKFKDIELYNKAIEKATQIISQTEQRILENNNQFFNKVYKPIRDNFVESLKGNLTIA